MWLPIVWSSWPSLHKRLLFGLDKINFNRLLDERICQKYDDLTSLFSICWAMEWSLFCCDGKGGEHVKLLPLATCCLGEVRMGASQNVMDFSSGLMHTMLAAFLNSLIWALSHQFYVVLVRTFYLFATYFWCTRSNFHIMSFIQIANIWCWLKLESHVEVYYFKKII
jgi:hypothetical protein